MKNIKDLTKDLQLLQSRIKAVTKNLPAIMGTEAVRMARLQIDKEGTINGGFRAWPKRVEVNQVAMSTAIKKGKDGKVTPGKVRVMTTDQGRHSGKKLLRRSGLLYRSISWRVSGNQVSIGVDLKTVPYARIHNEGGTIPITAKMRAFFMARFQATKNPFWFGMARHKGNKLIIPKRQFISLGPETRRAIEKAALRYIQETLSKTN